MRAGTSGHYHLAATILFYYGVLTEHGTYLDTLNIPLQHVEEEPGIFPMACNLAKLNIAFFYGGKI